MATNLKSLAKRARLSKGHVKAARAYKTRVAALISERAELRMQNMTEEAVKLRSDLRHTTMARARAEGREEKARKLKSGRGRASGGQERAAGCPG